MNMIQHLKQKKNKKGFTLAELLIVIAILAILVAIAVPVFTSQLAKAKAATDAANLRSAISVGTNELMTVHYESEAAAQKGVEAAIEKALGTITPQSGTDKLAIVVKEDGNNTKAFYINTAESKLAGQTLLALEKAAGQAAATATATVKPA